MDWATVAGWYTEQRFFEFPLAMLAFSVGVFFLLALPGTILAWFDPPWARRWAIQSTPFNVRQHVTRTLRLIVFNALILASLLILSWPLLRLTGIHGGPPPSAGTVLWQLMFFILLDDMLYYGMHRLFHENKWLLRRVHAVHHEIRTPYALAGNHMHWVEYVATATLVLIGPVLVNAHYVTLYLWIIWRQVEAVDGHLGYDFPWNPLRLLPGYDGPGYHDFHHARFKGNYAGFLHWIDRRLGTALPQWEAWKASRQAARKPAR